MFLPYPILAYFASAEKFLENLFFVRMTGIIIAFVLGVSRHLYNRPCNRYMGSDGQRSPSYRNSVPAAIQPKRSYREESGPSRMDK